MNARGTEGLAILVRELARQDSRIAGGGPRHSTAAAEYPPAHLRPHASARLGLRAYLKHLPVDYLKIDGGFVRDICSDPVAAALVESVNHVGHVVGARTIAECVEDEATRDRLAEMGVDFVQGFGISMPRPLDALLGRPLTRDSRALGSSAATLRQ